MRRIIGGLALIIASCQPVGPAADEAQSPLGGCAELGYHGACQGDLAVWCDNGVERRIDCSVIQERCGWVDDEQGFYCGGEPQGAEDFDGPIAGCGDVPADGACSGTELIWCANGTLRRLDCAVAGAICTYLPADSAYACVLGGEGEPAPPVQPEPQPEAPNPAPNQPEPEPEPEAQGPICDQGDGASRCEGATAVWCDQGEEQRRDCGGQGCGWVNDSIGYYCGGNGVGPGGPGPQPEPEPSANPEPPAPNPDPPAPNPDPPVGGGDCGGAEETAVVELVNTTRGMAGLPTLSCDGPMITAARAHSQDMCAQGYFSHTGRDGSQPWDRMRREGVQFRAAGENIALGQRDANQVHNSWMNSAGHRANILGNGWGRIGVGYVACNGRPLWTQVFAD